MPPFRVKGSCLVLKKGSAKPEPFVLKHFQVWMDRHHSLAFPQTERHISAWHHLESPGEVVLSHDNVQSTISELLPEQHPWDSRELSE